MSQFESVLAAARIHACLLFLEHRNGVAGWLGGNLFLTTASAAGFLPLHQVRGQIAIVTLYCLNVAGSVWWASAVWKSFPPRQRAFLRTVPQAVAAAEIIRVLVGAIAVLLVGSFFFLTISLGRAGGPASDLPTLAVSLLVCLAVPYLLVSALALVVASPISVLFRILTVWTAVGLAVGTDMTSSAGIDVVVLVANAPVELGIALMEPVQPLWERYASRVTVSSRPSTLSQDHSGTELVFWFACAVALVVAAAGTAGRETASRPAAWVQDLLRRKRVS